MRQKVLLKDDFSQKYNRSYVKKLMVKRLPFSRSSYIDNFREYTVIEINKKIINKIIRKLNKFLGKSFSKAIDFLKSSFVKEEDLNYFLRCFFVKPGDRFVNHKYYCDKNDCLAYHTIKRNENEEIKAFSKKQLVFNRNVKTKNVGKVYYEYRGMTDTNSNYYKIKYIGKFYVYVNGKVALKKVYHVPFLHERWYLGGGYTLDKDGVYSKTDQGVPFRLYRAGTVQYNRFKASKLNFIPVSIYTDFGEIDYYSHYYETKEYLNERTGEKYEKVFDLGFGKLKLAVFNNE